MQRLPLGAREGGHSPSVSSLQSLREEVILRLLCFPQEKKKTEKEFLRCIHEFYWTFYAETKEHCCCGWSNNKKDIKCSL